MNDSYADSLLIDDRSSRTPGASLGGDWRLVSDRVMGGISSGGLDTTRYQGRECLRLTGSVSTANNGGFLQMALDLAAGQRFDVSAYTGVALEVAGNDESYNVHLRTSDLWLPWQSWRASFTAGPQWREIRIPFSVFEAYRTNSRFRQDRLVRIGLVAIGREFDADLSLARLSLYRDNKTGGGR